MHLFERREILIGACLAGFVLGILYSNFIAADSLLLVGNLHTYYLEEFAKRKTQMIEYFPYLLKLRLTPILVIILAKHLKFRKCIVTLFSTWVGFLWGIYACISVAQFGVKGIAFCVIGIFPQIIFYIPAYIMVVVFVYYYPTIQWNSFKTFVFLLCLISGIFLEGQMNPIMLKWFIKML